MRDYLCRFGFGGAVTVIAGLVGKYFGPAAGGLFLAFPAIFPSTLTLMERALRRKGHQKYEEPEEWSESIGALLGTIGLACFGFAVWMLAGRMLWPWVDFAALAAWAAVSLSLWRIGQRDKMSLRHSKR